MLTYLVLRGIWLFLLSVPTTVTILLVAIALAYLLSPLIGFFERRGLGHLGSILLGYLTLAAAIAAFIGGLVPILVRNLSALAAQVPSYTREVEGLGQTIVLRYRHLRLPGWLMHDLTVAVQSLSAPLEHLALTSAQGLLVGTVHVVGYLEAILVALIISFYLLKDKDFFREHFLLIFPTRDRPNMALLLRDLNRALEGFIQGQLIIMAFVALAVTLGLALVGLPYAVLLGLVAGVLEIVPYLGAIAGAIPAVIVALLVHPISALFVLLVFVLVNQIEGHLVSPNVIGHRLKLSPIVVILALFAGAELSGLSGMILAVPIAAILRVLVDHAYQELTGRAAAYEAAAARQCPNCGRPVAHEWEACPFCGGKNLS